MIVGGSIPGGRFCISLLTRAITWLVALSPVVSGREMERRGSASAGFVAAGIGLPPPGAGRAAGGGGNVAGAFAGGSGKVAGRSAGAAGAAGVAAGGGQGAPPLGGGAGISRASRK